MQGNQPSPRVLALSAGIILIGLLGLVVLRNATRSSHESLLETARERDEAPVFVPPAVTDQVAAERVARAVRATRATSLHAEQSFRVDMKSPRAPFTHGDSRTRYQPPDRLHLTVSIETLREDPAVLETILIADEGWVHTGDQWQTFNAKSMRAEAAGPLDLLKVIGNDPDASAVDEGGDGLLLGMPTRRFRLWFPNFGKVYVDQIEVTLGDTPNAADTVESLRRLYDDATAIMTVTVVEDTDLIHRLDVEIAGRRIELTSSTLFNAFGEPVEITPPANVLDSSYNFHHTPLVAAAA